MQDGYDWQFWFAWALAVLSGSSVGAATDNKLLGLGVFSGLMSLIWGMRQ